jgi:hypothetical protein
VLGGGGNIARSVEAGDRMAPLVDHLAVAVRKEADGR